MWKKFALITIVLAIGITGCSDGQTNPEPTNEVTVDMGIWAEDKSISSTHEFPVEK